MVEGVDISEQSWFNILVLGIGCRTKLLGVFNEGSVAVDPSLLFE
jgi:hypothetical protein